MHTSTKFWASTHKMQISFYAVASPKIMALDLKRLTRKYFHCRNKNRCQKGFSTIKSSSAILPQEQKSNTVRAEILSSPVTHLYTENMTERDAKGRHKSIRTASHWGKYLSRALLQSPHESKARLLSGTNRLQVHNRWVLQHPSLSL